MPEIIRPEIKFREVHRRVVTPDRCDALGHMNIQYYFEALSDGIFNIMEILGLPVAEIPTRRTCFVLYKEESQFSEEIFDGDEFYMATALEHVGSKSIIFQHRFFSAADDRELFRSRFVAVNMNLDKRESIEFTAEVRNLALKEFPGYSAE